MTEVASRAEARKADLLHESVEVRQRILEAASRLRPDQRDEVFLGTWSVVDLLAHLIGWDLANTEAVQAILDGRLPAFYDHHDREWKTFNAQLVAEHRKDNWAELLASVQASHRDLLDLVETIPAGDLTRDTSVRFRGYRVTVAGTLESELKDERVHLAQIEEFARQNTLRPEA